MSTYYKQERHHDNWTGRVSRQSRITGTWYEQKEPDSIPLPAYLVGVAFLAILMLASFL
jgi:hypothetical protein